MSNLISDKGLKVYNDTIIEPLSNLKPGEQLIFTPESGNPLDVNALAHKIRRVMRSLKYSTYYFPISNLHDKFKISQRVDDVQVVVTRKGDSGFAVSSAPEALGTTTGTMKTLFILLDQIHHNPNSTELTKTKATAWDDKTDEEVEVDAFYFEIALDMNDQLQVISHLAKNRHNLPRDWSDYDIEKVRLLQDGTTLYRVYLLFDPYNAS